MPSVGDDVARILNHRVGVAFMLAECAVLSSDSGLYSPARRAAA